MAKDWDKIVKTEEKDEKLDGDAALNKCVLLLFYPYYYYYYLIFFIIDCFKISTKMETTKLEKQ